MPIKVEVQRLVLEKAKSLNKYQYYVELLERWNSNPLLMELEFGSDHLFLQSCVEVWLREKNWKRKNMKITTGKPDLIVEDDHGNIIAIQVDTFELWMEGIEQAKRYSSDPCISKTYVALPTTVCNRRDLREMIKRYRLGLIEIFTDSTCAITITPGEQL